MQVALILFVVISTLLAYDHEVIHPVSGALRFLLSEADWPPATQNII